MHTSAVYYRDAGGHQPVEEFLDEHVPVEPKGKNPSPKDILKVAKRRATIDNQIDRLNGLAPDDPPLPFPHSSQLDGQLRELRCHYGRELYRILYQRSDNLFILLHAIRKTTGAVPKADIKIAKDRFEDFQERMDASPRKPPRAAGGDAP